MLRESSIPACVIIVLLRVLAGKVKIGLQACFHFAVIDGERHGQLRWRRIVFSCCWGKRLRS